MSAIFSPKPTTAQSLRKLVDAAMEIERLLDMPCPLDPKVHGRASAYIFNLRLRIETQAILAEYRELMEAAK